MPMWWDDDEDTMFDDIDWNDFDPETDEEEDIWVEIEDEWLD